MVASPTTSTPSIRPMPGTRRVSPATGAELLLTRDALGRIRPRWSHRLLPVHHRSARCRGHDVCHPRPGLSCYSLVMRWVGFDPDGRIAYYQYTIDPPDAGD